MKGARPRDPKNHKPGCWRERWGGRGIVSNRVGEFRDVQLFPTINDAQRALLQSQSGPGAGSCAPHLPRLDSFTFRTLFCRRLRLPLPLTKHICRCGRRTDFYGHHRATCAQSGVFARRGFAVESVVARVCCEGGARVSTNIVVRDMDLAVPIPRDSRLIEVLVDGLPQFGGVQLDKHHTGFRSPLRWFSSSRGCTQRWCGLSEL